MIVAETVFPIPLDKSFDYAVPDALAPGLKAGHRVLAPLGNRRLQVGVVVRVHEESSFPFPLKPLTALLDPEPALSAEDLSLAGWLARRTFCSRGEAVFGVLPVGTMRPPKRETAPPAPPTPSAPSVPPPPTPDQAAALARMGPAVQAGGFKAFLLHGVNASGKTEVYLRLIDAALKAGRSAVLLVPEIGLTPQTQAHLAARFQNGAALWHSGLGRGERWRLWCDVRAGRVRVLAGPRSALFLPLSKLGLIVVDEEHDPSYKNDDAPSYHARDCALEKARLHGCAVVLGSATPSMESLEAARGGRLEAVRMAGRVGDKPFPRVTIVDMRKEKGWYLSDPLTRAIQAGLEKREQSILFLNRRGYATQVLCKTCGWEARCPNCKTSLVYHKPVSGKREAGSEKPEVGKQRELDWESPGSASRFPLPDSRPLRCHGCDHRQAFPSRCPECRGDVVAYRGRGTQRVEGDLRLLFPSARVLRWDRDTTRGKSGHGDAFRAVRGGDVDVVVGTQMIAQGLDFPRVTLGGVLDADRSLKFPDFRAGERTFQLLSQLAGRVGRGATPGEVIFQTRHPDHYAVQASRTFDYDAFAESELTFRRDMGYPPFVRLAAALVRSKDAAKAEKAADGLARRLEEERIPGLQALGPAPAFHHVRQGFSQWQVLLKGPSVALERAVPSVKGL